jgi:peptide-methionine (S)-S-oxide reductase
MKKELQSATLGGGCFWCLEGIYHMIAGVEKVVSGYAGGTGHRAKNPSYTMVCHGLTGHAEVVLIYFDPLIVDY